MINFLSIVSELPRNIVDDKFLEVYSRSRSSFLRNEELFSFQEEIEFISSSLRGEENHFPLNFFMRDFIIRKSKEKLLFECNLLPFEERILSIVRKISDPIDISPIFKKLFEYKECVRLVFYLLKFLPEKVYFDFSLLKEVVRYETLPYILNSFTKGITLLYEIEIVNQSERISLKEILNFLKFFHERYSLIVKSISPISKREIISLLENSYMNFNSSSSSIENFNKIKSELRINSSSILFLFLDILTTSNFSFCNLSLIKKLISFYIHISKKNKNAYSHAFNGSLISKNEFIVKILSLSSLQPLEYYTSEKIEEEVRKSELSHIRKSIAILEDFQFFCNYLKEIPFKEKRMKECKELFSTYYEVSSPLPLLMLREVVLLQSFNEYRKK